MKVFPTLCAFLLAGPVAFAQQVTNVTLNPDPLHACATGTFLIQGTAPPGFEITFINTSVDVGSVTLGIQASGASSGSVPFNATVPAGPYGEGTYTLSISLTYNGGTPTNWNGSFTVLPPNIPDVGEYQLVTVCPNDAPFTLLSQLGGTPDGGGIWLDPLLMPVDDGMFVPGESLPGGYMYYFDLLAPCETVYQSLVIEYHPNSSAGTDATVSLCTDPATPAVDLFPLLGGSPDAGGTWSGQGSSGVFVPGTSQPGQYVYEVTGLAPCPNPTATLTVEGVAASNAGTGGSAIFCFDNEAADLSAHLTGEDASGSWHGPSGFPIALHSDPVNVAAYGEGIYYYIVQNAPCPADSAAVTVSLDGPPCTLGIEGLEQASGMQLLPNPASGQVMLELHRARPGAGQYAVITDISGKQVMRAVLPAAGTLVRQMLDISPLAPGAYLVELVGGAPAPALRLLVR